MRSYDVIVVGLGAMGSATLCHLALGGHHVLGLEQFAPGHELGSSHGDSRIIREQYFEHPLYVPLVQRAYTLWRELEERSGKPLLTVTGGLMIGPLDGKVVMGTLRSAETHNLAHEILLPDEVHERYPAFQMNGNQVAVLDPRAGFLDADACNAAHIDVATRAGADAHFDERLIKWTADGDGVLVETNAGSYRANRLVLSAGAWTNELVRDLNLPLSIERQVLFWFDPDDARVSYDRARFPIYAYEYTPGRICYGFPRLARGVKAAVMHDGEIAATPADVRRTVSDDEVDPLRAALRPILPHLSAARVRESRVCLFTNTPDEDFLIDWHPYHPNVLIASPCSGHGFKFASAVGERVARMVVSGERDRLLAEFGIGRLR